MRLSAWVWWACVCVCVWVWERERERKRRIFTKSRRKCVMTQKSSLISNFPGKKKKIKICFFAGNEFWRCSNYFLSSHWNLWRPQNTVAVKSFNWQLLLILILILTSNKIRYKVASFRIKTLCCWGDLINVKLWDQENWGKCCLRSWMRMPSDWTDQQHFKTLRARCSLAWVLSLN